MKKIFFTTLAFLQLAISAQASVLPANTSEAVPVTKSIEQFNKISTKDIELINGKRVTGVQKIATKKTQKRASRKAAKGEKSQLVALILVLLVGVLGVHRFYLGYTWQGVLQLITFGGLGVWALIDLIRIVTGDLKPKNGEYTETL